jgi:hypothetical protein
MSSNTSTVDPWKEVFVDKDGIHRCNRCKHARPSVYQQGSSTVQTQNQSNQRNNVNQNQSRN